MNILVACEESQRVCIAFREKGHNAFSCDIQYPSGGYPEFHIQGDVLPLLNGNCTFKTMTGDLITIDRQWDLIIAHPPCTYLSAAGSTRLLNSDHSIKNIERYQKGIEAKHFFEKVLAADCKRLCVENPAPLKLFDLPPYSQIIQPFMFGDPWVKRTCLWLKGLPILFSTDLVQPVSCWVECHGKGSRTVLIGAKGARTAKDRSKTFPGIAKAMAEQWGNLAI